MRLEFCLMKRIFALQKPYEKPTIPNGVVFLELFNKSGERVKICISPSGFIQKC